MNKEKTRCPWVGDDEQMCVYHDTVWGVPKKKDIDIFEAIVLDTNQAGLSWKCILHKRDNFAKAYKNFDPEQVAKMGKRDVERLMKNAGIIRNRLKIESTISNAKYFLEIQKEYGGKEKNGFAKYVWSFTGGKTLVGRPKGKEQYRSHSPESDAMSKDLKKRGFKFVGTTIYYAFMQGIGMINDHSIDCFKSKK
jgi:DNA-3-methyladenine glycosylase I